MVYVRDHQEVCDPLIRLKFLNMSVCNVSMLKHQNQHTTEIRDFIKFT